MNVESIIKKKRNYRLYFLRKKIKKIDATRMSYNLQSGTYLKQFKKNFLIYKKVYNPFIQELKKININSILDFGTGELTILNYIRSKLKKNIIYYGCDLSFNRMFLGKKYFKSKINLFCNSDYRLPFGDNSIDVIMTTHALETNDFHIKKFLNEFYRVSRKAVIMLEPHYEIADKLSKLRMNKFKYLRNIEKNIKKLKLKYSIVRQKYHVNKKNPASIFIIKKNFKNRKNSKKINYINPYTKDALMKLDDFYYDYKNKYLFPTVDNIVIFDVKKTIQLPNAN
jgi:ubiquinone/menaquinone biosynthesis C-methylase UbiE